VSEVGGEPATLARPHPPFHVSAGDSQLVRNPCGQPAPDTRRTVDHSPKDPGRDRAAPERRIGTWPSIRRQRPSREPSAHLGRERTPSTGHPTGP
jgi:hypothetical protein